MHPWRALNSGTQVLVDPECGARAIIRDKQASGVQRFHWSVLPLGHYHPIAEGRTGELDRARSAVELVLQGYAEDCRADREDVRRLNLLR
jgi:hypothetical protein